MTKPFRRLHKKKMKHIRQEERLQTLWFTVRLLICMVVFLAAVGIRIRGGETFAFAKEKAEQFFGGTPKVTEVYRQSVDAIGNLYQQWNQEPSYD